MKATLTFQDLSFEEAADEVRVRFLGTYRCILKKDDLWKIGPFKVSKNSISFDASEKSATSRFNHLLRRSFEGLLSMNGRPTTYIHRNSGIPLIGSNVFGIIDRDTNVIEVKPLTGCNLSCTFCSVDEGVSGKKVRDFLVEEEYLVQEFQEIAGKKTHPLEAHIAGHAEPLLYPKILDLISDLRALKNVREVSIDTNGTLLSKAMIDRLAERGLTRIDLSVHSLDPKMAEGLAGSKFPLKRILEAAEYAKGKITVLLTPVFLPGVNDSDIGRIIIYAKEHGFRVGIQNFLPYDRGRRPVKGIGLDLFEKQLCTWEAQYGVDLHLRDLFDFRNDKVLGRPLRKGDRFRALSVSPGKYPDETICVAKGRVITLMSKMKVGDWVDGRIIREKHNIYSAVRT